MAYDPNIKFLVGARFQFGTLIFVADEYDNLQHEEPEELTISFELLLGLTNTAKVARDATPSVFDPDELVPEEDIMGTVILSQVICDIANG